MIKFEFTMSDKDAENLFDAVRAYALKNDEAIMECMAAEHMTQLQKDLYIKTLTLDKEYLLGLLEKMTNIRIE
jgi:hypothetical protein